MLLGDALGLDDPTRGGLADADRQGWWSAGYLLGEFAPQQLPAAVRNFVGRSAELNTLNGLLALAGRPHDTTVIGVIGGIAGVGKTALAVQWAHQVAGRFPDGQLFVDLHGFGASGPQVAPVEAVAGFLQAIGVPSAHIPECPAGRTSMYRRLLADKRMMVVLDNARSSEQVRPLLPDCPGCLVLVTSRSQLPGLAAAEGAWPVRLGVLNRADAAGMLAMRLNVDSPRPSSVDKLADLAGRLPLALSIVAASAASYPNSPLADLVAEMRDKRGVLNLLSCGEASADLRVAFSWSYQLLSYPAARLFRLLHIHPGPDVTTPAAASLAGVTQPEAHNALTELTGVGLLDEYVHVRFACHDLLRAYSREQSQARDNATVRKVARCRMLTHYLRAARAGMMLIEPRTVPTVTVPLDPYVLSEDLGTSAHATEWFAAERHVLIRLICEAARTGMGTYADQLSAIMAAHFSHGGRWRELAAWGITIIPEIAAADLR